ncbi:MAG: hypothetical protein PUH77_03725 [Bacteroidales bacterium]|nr:hypothetical protein [Bacteroidales bacterium]MDY5442092.1 hypothetical protein [Candidatus Cryptobacteroides sp.]
MDGSKAPLCDKALWQNNYVNERDPSPESVTKRAERAIGGARAACFEQPEGVYSGCGDARPAKYASCYSIYIRPRHEA